MLYRNSLRRGTAGIAIMAAVIAAPVAAQTSDGDQEQKNGSQSTSNNASQTSANAQSKTGDTQSMDPDQVIALVGETEITGGDLVAFVEALPPRMRQQPPQLLMPMGVEQLVLRELLLQKAVADNLAEDPEVVALVDESQTGAREDAMVRIALQRELESRVTDEEIQKVYDQAAEQADEDLPPLDEIRPQIRQQLQLEAVQEVRQDLASDVDVVVYGLDGASGQSTNSTDSNNEDSASGDSEAPSGSSEGSADEQ